MLILTTNVSISNHFSPVASCHIQLSQFYHHLMKFAPKHDTNLAAAGANCDRYSYDEPDADHWGLPILDIDLRENQLLVPRPRLQCRAGAARHKGVAPAI